MQFHNDVSLKNFNTFGIDVRAKSLIEIEERSDLVKLYRKGFASDYFIIGGGSNMLLTEDIHKTALYINNKGVEILDETLDSVQLRCQAGENWHDFVSWCVQQGYGGLENLALIPGKVGTAPVQNIGAYGVELKDCFVECSAIATQTSDVKLFTKEECKFSYRQSVFKSELRGDYVIDSVTFQLRKTNHELHLDYGSIRQELDAKNIDAPGIADVFHIVKDIRQSKLPDPHQVGNCGSFFKNPVVSESQFENIKADHPAVKFYRLNNGQVKIPAGWMIDNAGFKGFKMGNVGVHDKQALVLINLGQAQGHEVLQLAKRIQDAILEQYGLKLVPEVNIFPRENHILS